MRLTPPLTPDHQLKGAADGYHFYTFGITDIKACGGAQMSDDDLEGDEFVERVSDLVEKIDRDIKEGGYSLHSALPALADVIVEQCLASGDPNESMRHFIIFLLEMFAHFWPPRDDEP